MAAVEDYIKQQPSPQKEILQELRALILKTFPDASEEMKWGVPTYNEGKYYLVSLKDHVNIGFSIKGLSETELGFVEGTGTTMRHLKIRTLADIDQQRIVDLLQLVAKKS
jgi:uncharacterized protein YdhG (YjbR/CyaY superfamily)